MLFLLAALSVPAQYAPPPPEFRPRLRVELELQRRVPGRYDYAGPPQQMPYSCEDPRGYPGNYDRGGGYDRGPDRGYDRGYDRLPPFPPPPRGGRWETVQTYRGEVYLVPSYGDRCDYEGGYRNGNGGYRNGNGYGGGPGYEKERTFQGRYSERERSGGPPVREYREIPPGRNP